jgi:hypothetical protein
VGQAADELFELYQAALNPAAGEEGVLANGAGMPGPRGFCRSFSFDVGPLSFFGLDCRTRRGFYTDGAPRFVERDAQGQQPELDALASWARSLSGPGVLVLPQPLVETPATWLQRKLHVMGDVNLPDYGGDYRRIWDTLFCSTPHSILILTGDIHVSRLFEVRPLRVPGAFQKSIYELASSPLCHIKQGSSKPPGKSVTIDSSGHLGEERLVFARLWPPGLAHRRTYATVTFRPPLATRIVADIELWAAEASDPRGARGPYPLARHSLNLT